MTRTLGLIGATLLLAGCAALNMVHGEVSTYGEWPGGRAPGSYAFDRLPSQQAQPEQSARLEDSARPALARAGFVEAAPGQSPDVRVQVAAHSSVTEALLWADPMWRRGGWSRPYRVWGGPWGPFDSSFDRRYERQVALLIRDAASGKPLYEARASNEGTGSGSDALTRALFVAALTDFPRSGPNPRQVSVPLR